MMQRTNSLNIFDRSYIFPTVFYSEYSNSIYFLQGFYLKHEYVLITGSEVYEEIESLPQTQILLY